MIHIVSVLVENRPGVLSRTAGLFARRGFNITGLTVGETEDPTTARMTILVEGDDAIVEQVEKQLNKQIDIIKVKTLDGDRSTRRELVLVKVKSNPQTRGEILSVASVMKAEVVDISHTSLTVELSDRPERVDLMVELLGGYGIVEMARTGMVALQKGSDAMSLAGNSRL